MTSQEPTPAQCKVIDDWAQIQFGSQIAGRYILQGGEMPQTADRGYWRSDPPRVDLLAPAMVARLGDLVSQPLTPALDRDNVDPAHRWLHGLAAISPYQYKLQIPNGGSRLPHFRIIAAAATERGLDAAALMAMLFADRPKANKHVRPPTFVRFNGLVEWICDHAEQFSPYIATGNSTALAVTLDQMENVQLALFDDEVAKGLCAGKVKRADLLWRLTSKLGYSLLAPRLEHYAQHGKTATTRRDALLAMHRLAADPLERETLRTWSETHVTSDEAPEVQAALRQIAPETVSFDYELPDIDFDVLPDPEVKELVAQAYAAANPDSGAAALFSTDDMEHAWRILQGVTPTDDSRGKYGAVMADSYVPYLDRLPAAVQLRVREPRDYRSRQRPLREHFAAEPELQPLELWLLLERTWPRRWSPHRLFSAREWTNEEYLPLILHELEYFIGMIPIKVKQRRERSWEPSAGRDYYPFLLLGAMPRKAYDKFLAIGLQGSQDGWYYLADQPELFDDLVGALDSRKWAERMWAAKWLASIGDTRAAGPILDRFAKEKQLEARFAMIEALDALGEPPESYLDEDTITSEAATAMTKVLPSSLHWLDIAQMPSLRWPDGHVADPAIAQWLILQAAGLKRTYPTAMARSILGRLDDATVHPWCDFIFHEWINADQQFITTEDATQKAATRARLHLNWIERGIRPATNASGNIHSEESLIKHYLPTFAKETTGSEATSRGVLSLVSIGGTEAVVDPTVAYLRRFYGKRVHQARSLLEMLSYIDAPGAAPALLSVAHRFRTKGLQTFATEMAEDLAERKGWTLDDLRWRSVPDGGFDRDGLLTLDFGSRSLTAAVGDDLAIALTKEDGIELKKLPAPVVADDPDMAAAAKQDFNAAKKAMRSLAKDLPSRLHEAMCVRREWDPDEYRRFVLEHPALRLAATRAVWQQGDDRSNTRLFRPDRFGNVFDMAGSKIGLDDRPIVIAHGSLMHAGERQGWTDHIRENNVRPWFDQFSHTTHRPLEQGQTTLDHFQGAIFESDKRFVGSLGRLGWLRGDDRDGAFLRNMVKRFPAAGFTAHLNVGGLAVSFIGGEIVVLNLMFRPLGWGGAVPLTDVPRILLIETLAEIESFVATADRQDNGWHSNEYFQRRHVPEDVRPDLRAARA